MFDKDFYPTPTHVIDKMLFGEDVKNKVVLEPQAGKGDIIDYIISKEAKSVLCCELNDDLYEIVKNKAKVIERDFLKLTSDKISHIHCIIMNPPFSADARHILHAFDIAPPGCRITALCNLETIKNPFNRPRRTLVGRIEAHGMWEDLGDCFSQAERKTGVHVAMIKLVKPGTSSENEFEGFFMEEEPEYENQTAGIMSYNVVRDLVNRYVQAVKIFDEQLVIAAKMNRLVSGFFDASMSMSISKNDAPMVKEEFKKEMQRNGWRFIFEKMNLTKNTTKGLRDKINKFVEENVHIPFTMKNIYHMLDVVIQTTGQRMDTALLEVFDKLTEHHHDNRFNVEGWKTNSHYLVNKRFILPYMCEQSKYSDKKSNKIDLSSGSNFELVEDFVKALCYLSGDRYEKMGSLYYWIMYQFKIVTNDDVFYCSDTVRYDGVAQKTKKLYEKGIKYEVVNYKPVYGEWFTWSYFRCKCFKKGTMHFEFTDELLWGRFNQRIAAIKGFPLFEPKEQTKYQDRQTGRRKKSE